MTQYVTVNMGGKSVYTYGNRAGKGITAEAVGGKKD